MLTRQQTQISREVQRLKDEKALAHLPGKGGESPRLISFS